MATHPLLLVGSPTTGNANFDQGFLYLIPPLPPLAWLLPMRVDFYLEQTLFSDRVGAEGYYMVDPSTPHPAFGQGQSIQAQWNDANTEAWVNFLPAHAPVPRPTYIALGKTSSPSFTQARVNVLNPTITYPTATVKIDHEVTGVDLAKLIGVDFNVGVQTAFESLVVTRPVVPPGVIEQATVTALGAGVVTFTPDTGLLPTTIEGRPVTWGDPVVEPPFLFLDDGDTGYVTVHHSVSYDEPSTTGMWPLRQRQSLIGPGSWPLRQRQTGGHSGSWSLRQRQTGT